MTNAQIIMQYKKANNIPQEKPLFTFAAWRNMGYKVKKGEASRHRVPLWKYIGRQGKADTGGQEVLQGQNGKCFMKTVCLFEFEQVEKITAL